MPPALLALADGTIFHGVAVGAPGYAAGEVVFNTAMTGYQEILTDPSYHQQLVTLTSPHIGNTGVNPQDEESARVWAAGLIVREASSVASSWRSQQTLGHYLRKQNTVAIGDIDTRRLTRILREQGAQNGCIASGDGISADEALAQARAFPGLQGLDLAQVVSTDAPYPWLHGSWQAEGDHYPRYADLDQSYHVVAYDFGVKRNILRMLCHLGCRVTVVPARTAASEVLARRPDGIFLSNGPGDPAPCTYAIEAIRELLETRIPIFGICLGHQLLALASGAKTLKMAHGHHGANHPVQDLDTGEVLITSQNHGFAVDADSLPANLRATHQSLFDGSLQGISRTDRVAFGFQGHPEASPGPHDASVLFERFIAAMTARRMW